MAKHKHISEPDKHGYQVRIVRKGKEHSRYFSHRVWSGKKASLEAAIHWRDQMLVVLGKTNRKISEKGPLSSKKSTGVRGVTRSIQFDKRRGVHSLVYGVRWHDKNKIKNRTFFVGQVDNVSPDEDFHAFRTAVLFRYEYELCLELNIPFHPQRYVNWKTTRLYDVAFNQLYQALKHYEQYGEYDSDFEALLQASQADLNEQLAG
ncbi:MAG: hypothetical protein K0U68_16350 [Gammaproteobacteria bacterium]|nr:hypothetical protein [Gammaproteobacteria bacterium]